jgi:hypothetical protein
MQREGAAVKRLTSLVGAFAALLIVSVGCGGGTTDSIIPPGGTQMSIVASPPSPFTGSTVTFTVSAHNSQAVLTAVSIDFEDDGTWDGVQPVDQSSVTATFTHVYASAGGYIIRAEVKDANNVFTSNSMILIVSAPADTPVSYRVEGRSGIIGGDCLAFGPPITCAGCSTAIPSTGVTRSLGLLPQGAPAGITQAFSQIRLVNGTLDTHYSCQFSVALYAGAPGTEVQFGQGACATTSFDPENLACSVTASGTVP